MEQKALRCRPPESPSHRLAKRYCPFLGGVGGALVPIKGTFHSETSYIIACFERVTIFLNLGKSRVKFSLKEWKIML